MSMSFLDQHVINNILQWFWPAWLIPLLFFAPESPWHLVRRGRLEEAEKNIRRLQSPDAPIDPKQTLATIVYTNNLEEELSVGTSYWDCLKGFELRRTEIACLCFMGQVMNGTPIAYNATYFYEQIGLESKTIYNLNIGGYALALGGAFASWFFLMPRFGRRTIYLCGSAAMFTLLYIIGILTSWKNVGQVAEAQAYMTLVWKFTYQLSAGQMGWAIPAEVGSTRVRQKTIVFARNAYYILYVIGNVLQPYFMNPAAWNVGARTGKSSFWPFPNHHWLFSPSLPTMDLVANLISPSFLLGHHGYDLLHLGFLQTPRDQGPHIRAARRSLCQEGLCSQVCQDGCQCLRSGGDRRAQAGLQRLRSTGSYNKSWSGRHYHALFGFLVRRFYGSLGLCCVFVWKRKGAFFLAGRSGLTRALHVMLGYPRILFYSLYDVCNLHATGEQASINVNAVRRSTVYVMDLCFLFY